jgi:hypothetical protein
MRNSRIFRVQLGSKTRPFCAIFGVSLLQGQLNHWDLEYDLQTHNPKVVKFKSDPRNQFEIHRPGTDARPFCFPTDRESGVETQQLGKVKTHTLEETRVAAPRCPLTGEALSHPPFRTSVFRMAKVSAFWPNGSCDGVLAGAPASA